MKRYLAFLLMFDITMSFVLGIIFFRNDPYFFVKGFGLVAMSDVILSVVLRVYFSIKRKKYMKEHPEMLEEYDENQVSSNDLSMFR